MSGVLGATIGSYVSGNTLDFVYSTAVGGGTNSNLSIVHPASVQVGDIMILFHGTYDNDRDYIDAVPDGFQSILIRRVTYTTDTIMAWAISAKILTNVYDVFTPTYVGTTVDGYHYLTFYFRPNFNATTITTSSVNYEASTNAPTAQTVSASGQQTPILVFGAVQTTGVPAFNASTTPAFDFEQLVTASITIDSRVGYKLYNSNPQNHTIGMNDSGTQSLTSFWLSVS